MYVKFTVKLIMNPISTMNFLTLFSPEECSNAQSIPSEGKVIIEKSVELTPPGESFMAKAISVYFCRNQSVSSDRLFASNVTIPIEPGTSADRV